MKTFSLNFITDAYSQSEEQARIYKQLRNTLKCFTISCFCYRYQNELPKKIKSRGKDAHMVHEELVQCMKWKQIRGKFYPQLSYLVKVNTPRAVMAETKRAFRKLPNLEQAMAALSNLKGVGTTMASGKNISLYF